MAGYTPELTTYRLKFASRPGFEVVAKSVPVKVLLRVTSLAENLGDMKAAQAAMAAMASEVGAAGLTGIDDPAIAKALEAFGELGELFMTLGDALVSWNLEIPAGVPVPCDLNGVLGQELDLVLDVLMGWMEAIGAVGAPLPPPSNGGAPYPEDSIQMAPLPASLAS